MSMLKLSMLYAPDFKYDWRMEMINRLEQLKRSSVLIKRPRVLNL